VGVQRWLHLSPRVATAKQNNGSQMHRATAFTQQVNKSASSSLLRTAAIELAPNLILSDFTRCQTKVVLLRLCCYFHQST